MSKAKIEELPKEYQDIWRANIMHVDTNISFDSVILSEENKKKYGDFIQEQKFKDKLISYGLEPMNRLLLFGNSGCGKTYSLKALSNLLDCTMLYIDIAQALSNSNVAMNILDIFKLGNYIAAKYGGCMVFLDECDAVAWNRDSSASDSGTVRRATNTIFECVDQMDSRVIFCAATNMLHRLDAAFARRFNVKMRFTRPLTDLDTDIKHFLFQKFSLNDDVDPTVKQIVKKRAQHNQKLSYYEIEEITKKAMKKAVLNNSTVVNSSDIYNDIALSMGFRVNLDLASRIKETNSTNLTK